MVKRLESSFFAFKKSLKSLRDVSQGMVEMFERDKIIISPELKIKDLQAKGIDLDDIIKIGEEKFKDQDGKFAVYTAAHFKPEFLNDLKNDINIIDGYIALWDKVTIDPKLDIFIEYLNDKLFNNENPTGKLVVFSESKDTVGYLERELKERLGRNDILAVSSEERKRLFDTIKDNFDANTKGNQKNDYNIIITTDVLAEGVNLHRANVIVNYDTPWNASRLMQRIGRVNRIGSVAGKILNYMFYPSVEGDGEIKLYKNALAKLQGFHTAFGEDSQIYSTEEVVGQFELYNPKIGDDIDKTLSLIRELREFKNLSPKEYELIKSLPYKSRTARNVSNCNKTGVQKDSSLIYISSAFKQEFYKVDSNGVKDIGFLEAVELFKADKDEPCVEIPESHYKQVLSAYKKYDTDVTKMLDDGTKSNGVTKDNYYEASKKILREIWRSNESDIVKEQCEILTEYVELGKYNLLTRQLAKMEQKYRKTDNSSIEILHAISELVTKYHKNNKTAQQIETDITARIVISETFV